MPSNEMDIGTISKIFPGFNVATSPEITPKKIAKRIE